MAERTALAVCSGFMLLTGSNTCGRNRMVVPRCRINGRSFSLVWSAILWSGSEVENRKTLLSAVGDRDHG